MKLKQMKLRRFRRPLAAVTAIIALLFLEVQPALADAARRPAPSPPVVSKQTESVDMLRRVAAKLRHDSRPRARRFARTLDAVILVQTAETPARRRAAVAALPGKIVRTPLQNGLVLKQYVHHGVVIKQVVEAVSSPVLPEAVEVVSGPFARTSDCFENAEEPCLTEQEEIEWEAELDAAEVEAAASESESYAMDDEMTTFCNQNPQAIECEGGSMLRQSGPNVRSNEAVNCWGELQNAIAGAGEAVFGVAGYKAMQQLSKSQLAKMGAAQVVLLKAGMWLLVAAGLLSLGFLLACAIDMYLLGPLHSSAVSVLSVRLLREEGWIYRRLS